MKETRHCPVPALVSPHFFQCSPFPVPNKAASSQLHCVRYFSTLALVVFYFPYCFHDYFCGPLSVTRQLRSLIAWRPQSRCFRLSGSQSLLSRSLPSFG